MDHDYYEDGNGERKNRRLHILWTMANMNKYEKKCNSQVKPYEKKCFIGRMNDACITIIIRI